MRAEIAVFLLNLSDIIFLPTAPHSSQPHMKRIQWEQLWRRNRLWRNNDITLKIFHFPNKNICCNRNVPTNSGNSFLVSHYNKHLLFEMLAIVRCSVEINCMLLTCRSPFFHSWSSIGGQQPPTLHRSHCHRQASWWHHSTWPPEQTLEGQTLTSSTSTRTYAPWPYHLPTVLLLHWWNFGDLKKLWVVFLFCSWGTQAGILHLKGNPTASHSLHSSVVCSHTEVCWKMRNHKNSLVWPGCETHASCVSTEF